MRTFVSTDGCHFIFPNVESGYMGSTTVPTLDAVLEFAAFINEERAAIERGPSVVPQYSTLLLNGGFLKIDNDFSLPEGAIHFLNEMGRRVVLRGGRESGFQPNSRVGSREGLRLAGATVVADATVIQQREGSQGVPGQLEE